MAIAAEIDGGPGWTTLPCDCPCGDECPPCTQPTTVCVTMTNIFVDGVAQPDISGDYTVIPGQPGVQGQLIFTIDGTGGVVSWGCATDAPTLLAVAGQFDIGTPRVDWAYGTAVWTCSPFSIGPIHIEGVRSGFPPPPHVEFDLTVTSGPC